MDFNTLLAHAKTRMGNAGYIVYSTPSPLPDNLKSSISQALAEYPWITSDIEIEGQQITIELVSYIELGYAAPATIHKLLESPWPSVIHAGEISLTFVGTKPASDD